MARRQTAITRCGDDYLAHYRERGWLFWGPWHSLVIGNTGERMSIRGTADEASYAAGQALINGVIAYDSWHYLPIISINEPSS